MRKEREEKRGKISFLSLSLDRHENVCTCEEKLKIGEPELFL